MRVLLANHTAAMSGAEVALMQLVRSLGEQHDIAVACPSDGPLAEALAAAGVTHLPIPAVALSLRLDALRTPAGIAQLGVAAAALARTAHRFRADVVHANTMRTGLMGAVARGLGAPPVVVRVHESLPPTVLGGVVRSILARSSAAVVAVSDHTARAFDEGLAGPRTTRVYNAIDHERFDPRRVSAAPLRVELGVPAGAALLGQVGQITPWKGQDTAIRALGALRASGIDAHLAIVGHVAFTGRSVRFDNDGYLDALTQLVADLGLADRVHFLGRRHDVPAVLRALDVSLVPSWSEPFGLVIVESMAMGVPPLVTSVGGSAELVEDGVTGRLLPPREPDAWARAVGGLLADPPRLAGMGRHARRAAAGFRGDVHAAQMSAVWAQACARPGVDPGGRSAGRLAPAVGPQR